MRIQDQNKKEVLQIKRNIFFVFKIISNYWKYIALLFFIFLTENRIYLFDIHYLIEIKSETTIQGKNRLEISGPHHRMQFQR